MDVKLLGVGVVVLLNKFYIEFGVHPLDIDTTTLASYSSYLMQHHLMQNKRPGQWSPNLLPMYGALKSSATGGLTMVTRTSADSTNEKELPINSHLLPDNEEKGECVLDYDVNSLYPGAGLFDLPFGPGYFSLRPQINKLASNDNFLFNNQLDEYSHNVMESKESQAVQYLSLVEHSNAKRVYSSFHAGPGQLVFGKTHKRYVDLTVLGPKAGQITVIQFHEKSHQTHAASHDIKCRYNFNNKDIDYNFQTQFADDENKRYAEFLSMHLKEHITIEYKTYNECDFFHGNSYAWKDKTANCLSPKEYLLTHNYKDDCLFKPDWLKLKLLTQDELMNKIQNSDQCDTSFVVLEKGAKENADDEIADQFAFCLQRSSPTIDELGSEAFNLAKEIVECNTEQRENECKSEFETRIAQMATDYLKNRVDAEFTMTRKSFHKDQCLPVSYFKWLLKHRNLTNIKILHYIHYEPKTWGRPYLKKLLQKRRKLKKAGEGDSLLAFILKILSNAFYGQTLMEKNKYHKYTYATEEHLKYNPPLKAININLLTLIKKNESDFSFLYNLKYPLTNAKINNLMQVGCTILGYSRKIFYHQIFTFLRLLDKRKIELCYLDTDSVMFFSASVDIKKCVKKGKEKEFEVASKKWLFENPNSTETQAGLMKLEGCFQSAYFLCVKNYVLIPFPETEQERIVKSKGNARVIQKKMPDSAFYTSKLKRKIGLDSENDDPTLYFQHYALHPTMSEEICISVKRRKMANAINCKRRMTEVNNFFFKKKI